MEDRNAVDTIRGYFYQFNKSILEIINLEDENYQATIEGIEDIDLDRGDETLLIQCKYYSGQEYNHSGIKPSIIMFFKHFVKHKDLDISYKLYANFNNGQDKLPSQLSIEFVKKNFLTFVHNKVKHVLYEEYNVNDLELETFIKRLNIDICAPSYEQLENDIKTSLKKIKKLDTKLLDFYISKAESIVKVLATSKNQDNRKITKKEFISKLLDVNVRFDEWYICKIGYKKYYSMMRKNYFTAQNISPFERFFMIDCSFNNDVNTLKKIVYTISKKWSKITQRSNPSFCPYIIFYNISEEDLLGLKQQLFDENFYFIDGYCFKNSAFNVDVILITATYYNKIRIKFIEMDNLNKVLEKNQKTKIIYQFYLDKIFYTDDKYNCINIKLDDLEDLLSII